MTRRIPALAVALVLLAAPLLAACGSGSNSANANGGTTTTMRSHTTAATVKTASASGLGTILVDGQGRAIYLFQRDTGPTSTCSGACIAAWPAVTTHGRPQAAGGVAAAKLGVTKRGDGTMQVTYAGHPLYYYAGDAASGETNGQALNAFGAPWYVLGTNGGAITTQTSGGSSGGGY
ncbi:MAG: COG4315 family predicted lipoprotein [Conexibacter sp.]